MTLTFATVAPPLVGGMLIGLAAGLLYLVQGRIAGVSSIARSMITNSRGRIWRLAFLLGLVLAGVMHAIAGGTMAPALRDMPLPLLAIAGGLVGFGSGLGSGCTSGHGVCGIARLSHRSIAAVLVFMATASLTVYIVRHGGTL